jgi:hypothetical protein
MIHGAIAVAVAAASTAPVASALRRVASAIAKPTAKRKLAKPSQPIAPHCHAPGVPCQDVPPQLSSHWKPATINQNYAWTAAGIVTAIPARIRPAMASGALVVVSMAAGTPLLTGG